MSKLTAKIAAPALSLVNTSTGAAATALNLTVASGKPPLTVNAAAGKATNLHADKLDGVDSTGFLGSTAKAQDADKIDGLDSTILLPGGELPSGRTVRGTYMVGGTAQTVGSHGFGSISFGYTLTSKPIVQVIRVGQAATAECPGTYNYPEAVSGYLCIYEADRFNQAADYPRPVLVNRSGTGFYTFSAGTGMFDSVGTWAVTGN